jgi:predicted Zn-ribbon and HTH transcriptional regulator
MEYQEGQPCPACNSDKISILQTRQVIWEVNLSTDKLIRKEKDGAIEFWQYKCRKCGWISESFQE